MQKFSFIQQEKEQSSNTKGIEIKQAGMYNDYDPKYQKYLDQQNNLQIINSQQPGRNNKQKIFDEQPNQIISGQKTLFKLKASTTIPNDQFYPPDQSTSIINVKQTQKGPLSECEACNYLDNHKKENNNQIKSILFQTINNQLNKQNTIIMCQCGQKIRTIQLKEIKDEIFQTQLMQNQIEVIRNGPLKGLILNCNNQVCDYFCIFDKKQNSNKLKCPVCFSQMK